MILLQNNKEKLTLEIEGYSYPFAREYWDANWLNIKITIQNFTKNSIYKNNDPCLLTIELLNLKNWFSKLKYPDNDLSPIKFMEPVLSFAFKKSKFIDFIKIWFKSYL